MAMSRQKGLEDARQAVGWALMNKVLEHLNSKNYLRQYQHTNTQHNNHITSTTSCHKASKHELHNNNRHRKHTNSFTQKITEYLPARETGTLFIHDHMTEYLPTAEKGTQIFHCHSQCLTTRPTLHFSST